MSLCDEGLCFASSDFLSLGEPKSSKVRKAFKKSQKKVRKPNHPSQPKAQRRGSKNLPTRGIPGRFLSLVLIPPNTA